VATASQDNGPLLLGGLALLVVVLGGAGLLIARSRRTG
jgi:hypothetical protein